MLLELVDASPHCFYFLSKIRQKVSGEWEMLVVGMFEDREKVETEIQRSDLVHGLGECSRTAGQHDRPVQVHGLGCKLGARLSAVFICMVAGVKKADN